jgi:cyclopropane fatty-acyl-phospholipid synthase-like methyltransferase
MTTNVDSKRSRGNGGILKFMGPQPVSITLKNVIPPMADVTSIRVGYSVTDKADGYRGLLFVSQNSNVYLLDTRLNVKYTGLKYTGDISKPTCIDGEVLDNPSTFLVFDAYILEGEKVMNNHLGKRLEAVSVFIDKLQPVNKEAMQVIKKKFYMEGDIFENSKLILEDAATGENAYDIDGLIYTPIDVPVGGTYSEDQAHIFGTWTLALKWKPPEQNSIDVLVKLDDVIRTDSARKRYMEANMYVGADLAKDSAVMYKDILCRRYQQPEGYGLKQFVVPGTSGKLRIDLDVDSAPRCQDGDIIVTDTVVECYFDGSTWKPMRNRTDKTERARKYGTFAGAVNDITTAERVWLSIKYPVTKDIISGSKTVNDIPYELQNDDVYYVDNDVARENTATYRMRIFHNYLKENVLLRGALRVAELSGKKLCDLGCGRGGDIGKYMNAGIYEVLGLDLFEDNIQNAYLRLHKRVRSNGYQRKNDKYRYAFVPMDLAKHIDLDSIQNKDLKEIGYILWGKIPSSQVDDVELRPYYAMAKDGFDVIAAQFMVHYFFKDTKTLETFVDNVDQLLKSGGRFIGTCMDGSTVDTLLRKDTNAFRASGNRIIWQITRRYTVGKHDLGQEIDVFVESIGKTMTEYVCYFELLQAALERKDITLVESQMFSQTYERVVSEGVGKVGDAIRSMTESEKEYSFLNRWFVFQKK